MGAERRRAGRVLAWTQHGRSLPPRRLRNGFALSVNRACRDLPRVDLDAVGVPVSAIHCALQYGKLVLAARVMLNWKSRLRIEKAGRYKVCGGMTPLTLEGDILSPVDTPLDALSLAGPVRDRLR